MEQVNPLVSPATPPQMPVNPPASQPVKTSSSSKPILIVLLVVLLVVLSSLATYFIVKSQSKPQTLVSSPRPISSPNAQPPPTPSATDLIAEWKEYTSTDRTYLFKYPSAWKLNDGNNFVNAFCEKCQVKNTVDLFQVTKIIYKSIDEYIQKNTVMTDYKKIKFSNRDALMVVIPGGPQAGGSSLTIFIINNEQGYELAYRFTNLMNKTKISDFPEANPDILSTFQFLD